MVVAGAVLGDAPALEPVEELVLVVLLPVVLVVLAGDVLGEEPKLLGRGLVRVVVDGGVVEVVVERLVVWGRVMLPVVRNVVRLREERGGSLYRL